ncbi:MAG: ATP-binding protein [Planctomycetota bacterium]|jgi:anti-sigma regulatory factor (Ser/Thr protein kinase)
MTKPVCKNIRIPNETSYLAAVREAVREVVLGSDFPDEELNRLTLAVDESVTNVMEHAYENDLEGEMFIEVALEATDLEFVACIRDWGSAFDPTAVPAPDLSAHVREGRRHGLGIFLIRQIMDEATYTSDADGCNELKLVKRVARAAAPVDGAARPAADAQAAPPAAQAPEPSRPEEEEDTEDLRAPAPASAARAEPDLPAAPASAARAEPDLPAADPEDVPAEVVTKAEVAEAGEIEKAPAKETKKATKAKKPRKAKKAGKAKKARKAKKPK